MLKPRSQIEGHERELPDLSTTVLCERKSNFANNFGLQRLKNGVAVYAMDVCIHSTGSIAWKEHGKVKRTCDIPED